MRLLRLVETSEAVRATSSRLEKVARLAALLAEAGPDEIGTVVAWLGGSLRQGRIGLGFGAAHAAARVPPAPVAALEVADVDRAFDEIAALAGPGSQGRREAVLAALLARATREEQDLLVRLIVGEMRHGALETLVVEALAKATGLGPDALRRSVALSGDLVGTARAARLGDASAASSAQVRLFRPLAPMLAQTAADAAEALEAFGETAFEEKLDGARIQVHRDGDEVRVFTRTANDITYRLPEVVAAARALPVREAILDGEALVLRPDGSPQPFQTSMRRLGRSLDVAAAAGDLPVVARFFDALWLDGAPWIDRPAAERFDALRGAVPEALRPARLVTADLAEAEAFFERTLRAGHEGLMAKDPKAPYAPGRRDSAWRKIKRAHALDLVVLAAEWGSGRRTGLLSNLHLGARDGAGFAMLGKTFKGLTDATLAWQTAELLARETGREGHVVHVRPELVVEIAFDGVQASPRYPAGLALRFARVRRYRSDKTALEADEVATVRALHERALRAGGKGAWD